MKNPKNAIVKIYELRDPRDLTCSPRYVGITTKSLKDRLYLHIYDATSGKKHYRANWSRKLIREGVAPTIHLIEEVIGWEYACEVEKYWIKEFREQGYKLTNSTDGGEGRLGFHPSQETIDKITSKTRGRIFSQEIREKMAKSALGRKVSNETREKISRSCKGVKKSKEAVAKRYKKVIQMNSNGEFIQEWKSLEEAAISLGSRTNGSGISKCCNNRRKHAFGFRWKFSDN